jgi:peroxiredoxin
MKALRTLIGIGLVVCVVLMTATEARADRLRKINIGQPFPAFTLMTTEGTTVTKEDYTNKVLVLVFLSAEQTSSEEAAIDAARVIKELGRDDIELLFVSRDVIYKSHFQDFMTSNELAVTMCFDTDRALSDQIGLIVLPTTIFIDRDGRLAHVVSIHRADYAKTLDLYALHTLGIIDQEGMQERFAEPIVKAKDPDSLVARHRAVARLLREKGLYDNAQRELRTALNLNPDDVGCQLDLASLLLVVDRIDDARRVVDTVLNGSPANRHAQLLRGIILYREEKFAEAEPLFQKLLVLNPDPARTHYYLARIYERQDKKEKALHHYHEALVRLMGDEIE